MQRKKDEPIKDVDGIAEAILYFFKFILPKNYIKILSFVLLLGLLIFFIFTGYNCETKWIKFNKDPVK